MDFIQGPGFCNNFFTIFVAGDGYGAQPPVPPVFGSILLENGQPILLENGQDLLLEANAVEGNLAQESGFLILNENGNGISIFNT